MAAIVYRMNNLTITVEGTAGYINSVTYDNPDPLEYVFRSLNRSNGQVTLYRFLPNQPEPVALEGFRRIKTDDALFSFLGANYVGP